MHSYMHKQLVHLQCENCLPVEQLVALTPTIPKTIVTILNAACRILRFSHQYLINLAVCLRAIINHPRNGVQCVRAKLKPGQKRSKDERERERERGLSGPNYIQSWGIGKVQSERDLHDESRSPDETRWSVNFSDFTEKTGKWKLGLQFVFSHFFISTLSL